MSINSVEISGNLARDCEVRSTQGGTTVVSFGVAVSRRERNAQTGQWEDRPSFVDCVMFDKDGSRQWMTNHLRKGFKVFVRGELSQSTWQDRQTGQNRSKLEVIVRDIDASWPPKRQQPQGYQQGYYPQQQPQAYQQPQQAPQQPQQQYAANYAPQQQYAPQQAPQPPQQPPQQQAPMQQQMPMQQVEPVQAPADQVSVYDEDIPF